MTDKMISDERRRKDMSKREEQILDEVKRVFGPDSVKKCKDNSTKKQRKKLKALSDSVNAFIKKVDQAFERTKGSQMQFD